MQNEERLALLDEAMKKNMGIDLRTWAKMDFNPLESPTNASTGRDYTGTNAIYLQAISALRGYDDRTWATFRQWGKLGYRINKGSKAAKIAFYPSRGQVRYAHVFHASQVYKPEIKPQNADIFDEIPF